MWTQGVQHPNLNFIVFSYLDFMERDKVGNTVPIQISRTKLFKLGLMEQ